VEQVPQCETFRVVETRTEEETCATGVQLVLDDEVKGVVKGQVHTSTFMRPVLGRLRTERRVSHVFLIELPTYHKLLAVTDAAVNIGPDLTTKAAIANNAIGLARTLGVDVPKVAALSSIETVNPAIPSTLDAACLSKMAERGQIKGALVDGPLAFDGAISAESARIKGIDSSVAGDVDIVLVPDIDAGNILVKDLEYLANATLAGIVLGAAAPVVLTSRADPPRSRLLSCALAAYVAHHERPI
jgi:phosphotransacetylase